MRIERRFTQRGHSPYESMKFVKRSSEIRNPDGSTVFKLDHIDVPERWTQLAVDILAQKYFRKAGVPQVGPDGKPLVGPDGKPVLGGERDARRVFNRLAGCWTHWGKTHGYFNKEEDAAAFYDETCYMLARQMAAPNSPQWFNTGLHYAYGLSGPSQGHYYVDPKTRKMVKAANAFEHPQPHACQPYHALVSTPQGPMPIGEIVAKELIGLEVYDGTGKGAGTTKVVAVKSNGEKPVFRILLRNGACVEATGDHLVYALGERRACGAWRRVDDLAPDMRLQLSTGTSVAKPSEERDVWEAALAGWLQGDGFVGQVGVGGAWGPVASAGATGDGPPSTGEEQGANRSLTIEFMTIDKDEFNFVIDRAHRVFAETHYHVRSVETQTPGLDVKRIRLYGEGLRPFVEKYGLLRGSEDLSVPASILTAGLQAQTAYLAALFQADGTVRLRRRSSRTADVVLTTVSQPLALGVQALLLNLGIYAGIQRGVDNRENRRVPYFVSIGYADSRARFRDLIGFVSEEKKRKLEAACSTRFPGKRLPGLREESIVRIEALGVQPVCDIQTESGQYLSNNVIVHNCFIQSVDDDLVNDGGIMDLWTREARLFKYGSGCTAGDSRIYASGFGLIPIRDLFHLAAAERQFQRFDGKSVFVDVADKNFFTLAIAENGEFKLDRIDRVWQYDIAREDKLRVAFSNGARVSVSCWHPFLVWDGKQVVERRADELCRGDIVLGANKTVLNLLPNEPSRVTWTYTLYNREHSETILIDEDVAWVVGYFLGDGSLGRRTFQVRDYSYQHLRLRFFDESREVLAKAERILGQKFETQCRVRPDGRGSKGLTLQVMDQRTCAFFAKFSLPGPKNRALKLPPFIVESPPAIICAFLAGLLDSDGHVTSRGKAMYGSASRNFAEEIAALASLLGIGGGAIRDREVTTACVVRTSVGGAMREEIGKRMANAMRRERLLAQPGDHRDAFCMPLDPAMLNRIIRLPERSSDWLNVLVEDTGFHLGRLKYEGLVNPHKLRSILMAAGAERDLGPEAEMLMRVAESATAVTEIDYLEEDIDFYDLTVRQHNNYLAGERGLVVIHNTGTNFSKLRGDNESLSGGGRSSGLMSFLKIGDRAAGAIKSGGTTRRAAKMVCLDLDHPDVEEFIDWKVVEEQKVAAMVTGSKICAQRLNAVLKACRAPTGDGQAKVEMDPEKNPTLKKAIREARLVSVPEAYIQRMFTYAQEGFTHFVFHEYDTNWDGKAYQTVSGQNSNNSIRIPNGFFEALEKDGDWLLKRRTDGKVVKTVKARELWDKIAWAAWICADPGTQYDTTINEWHTCPEDGRINASNPCCVTGDTLIAVADGRNAVPIKDLVGQEIPVYAHNHATGRATISRMWNIGIKRRNVPVFRVTLDDGSSFRATDDHLILLRDGAYRQVKDLMAGDSLMPFHSKILTPAETRTTRRYYWTGASWQPQYRAVWNYANGPAPDGFHIHHSDYDALNDELSNLRLLSVTEHTALHGDMMKGDANPARRLMTEEWRRNIAAAMKGEKNPNYGHQYSEESRSLLRAAAAIRWSKPSEHNKTGAGIKAGPARARENGARIGAPRKDRYERSCPVCRQTFKTLCEGQLFCSATCRYSPLGMQMIGPKTWEKNRGRHVTEEQRAKLSVSVSLASDPETKRRAGLTEHRNRVLRTARLLLDHDLPISLASWEEARDLAKELGATRVPHADVVNRFFDSDEDLREQVLLYNHQVISVELDGHEDVYDGTVDGHHNFAILTSAEPSCAESHLNSSGLFVHNSEYMFLDDTACNLASLNLGEFYTPDGRFLLEDFKHAVRLWTIALEISVLMASFPSKAIAQKSFIFRTLGLGYANLGTVLMRLGIPYDSPRALAICGALTATLTGESYAASAEMAAE
ncbi:MAG: HNH endonuclease, partial [Nitrospirae bacterium]|nr:HNH endonuclease [Nitrospirota bacterium]